MMFSVVSGWFYELVGNDTTTWPTDSVLAYANTALARLAQATEYAESRSTILITSGTAEYALPSDCRRVFRVTYDGDRIFPVLQSHLKLIDEQWDQRTGTPTHYYLDGLNKYIGLYKKPATSTQYFTFSQDDGTVVGVVVDGVVATANQDDGVVVDITDTSGTFSWNQEDGELVRGVSSLDAEVFYVAKPAAITDLSNEMPIPTWAAPYVLFSMLEQAYGADTVRQNGAMSQFWSRAAAYVLMRLRFRVGNRCWLPSERSSTYRLKKGWIVTIPVLTET